MREQQRTDHFWEQRTYEASDGRVVVERIPVGEAPGDFARFIGYAKLNVNLPTGQQTQHQLAFAIPADNITEAMAQFHVYCEPEAEKAAARIQRQAKQQLRRQQIVTPNGGRLGGNGRQ